MQSEVLSIKSEIFELERILSEIPEENRIERLSFQHRLEKVQEELKEFDASRLPEKIFLAFRGDPVHGNHGIDADFAGKILGIFSEAFAALVDVARGVPLGSDGYVSKYGKHKLVLTGLSVDSLGFEFELPNTSSTAPLSSFPEENPVEKACLMLSNVLAKTFRSDDDQLAESIECIEQPALDKINDFF